MAVKAISVFRWCHYFFDIVLLTACSYLKCSVIVYYLRKEKHIFLYKSMFYQPLKMYLKNGCQISHFVYSNFLEIQADYWNETKSQQKPFTGITSQLPTTGLCFRIFSFLSMPRNAETSMRNQTFHRNLRRECLLRKLLINAKLSFKISIITGNYLPTFHSSWINNWVILCDVELIKFMSFTTKINHFALKVIRKAANANYCFQELFRESVQDHQALGKLKVTFQWNCITRKHTLYIKRTRNK